VSSLAAAPAVAAEPLTTDEIAEMKHHLAFIREYKDVLRVKAKPRAGYHMETLGFYFPMVDADSAELDLHWGTTVVPMAIKASQ